MDSNIASLLDLSIQVRLHFFLHLCPCILPVIRVLCILFWPFLALSISTAGHYLSFLLSFAFHSQAWLEKQLLLMLSSSEFHRRGDELFHWRYLKLSRRLLFVHSIRRSHTESRIRLGWPIIRLTSFIMFNSGYPIFFTLIMGYYWFSPPLRMCKFSSIFSKCYFRLLEESPA